ncbi:DinB family protein [Rubripirellula tenax]|uniref:DinB family protein n=1 Tax=Rubripirellula tenax TaxID=2528015 RepID=A0A5C6E3Y4_9BACT|nr:DinB family protein [Rubripirellula tenax]TWU43598.1 DinB family protein [Rubripirellula tenax]
MTIAEMILPEFDAEMASTRVILALVPKQKFDWKAAESLHTIGWNANHLAEIVGWTLAIIEEDEFDIAPVDGPKHDVPSIDDPSEILANFDEAVLAARASIESATDQRLAEEWSMKMGGQILFTMTKGSCLRTWVLNHSVHHRGILSVYLRMCGVKMTPVYDG